MQCPVGSGTLYSKRLEVLTVVLLKISSLLGRYIALLHTTYATTVLHSKTLSSTLHD